MRLVIPVALIAAACATSSEDPAEPTTRVLDSATDTAIVGDTATETAWVPDGAPSLERVLTDKTQVAAAPTTPPQCYGRTFDSDGVAHNTCFTCHQASRSPNYLGAPELQVAYDFPEPVRVNPWTNPFVDRTAAIAAVPDAEIVAWARHDNYFQPDGTIRLAQALRHPPAGWDSDGDGEWSGYIPDNWLNPDAQGFDRRPDGTPTGWRAYAWAPFSGAFWPTNGSATDAFIRLPELYRTSTVDGLFEATTYAVNLAIVEAVIKREDVAIEPVDEISLGVDLDKDGTLGWAERVAYDWAPKEGRHMSWAGAARVAQEVGEVQPPTAGLFPQGTQLFHTLRYFDVVDGDVKMGQRMKEVRFLEKRSHQTYGQLREAAVRGESEARAWPDRVEPVHGDAEWGVSVGAGWRAGAFIEDEAGYLRPQTFEELGACAGCHGGVGGTEDRVFSFSRKLSSDTATARGWYHWGTHGMAGVGDPRRADGSGDYETYLREARAGDPYRANTEVMARFFDEDGQLDEAAVAALKDDARPLLLPSAERALLLDKVYREIVKEQSFIRGRDPVHGLSEDQLWREVDEGQPTKVERVVKASWQP